MSTTVTYKGATLTTVDNATVTLNTAGKYCEDDFTLTDVSGGGGTAKTVDISLSYSQNPAGFVSFTVYEGTYGDTFPFSFVKGQQIGTIASANGSTTVTVSADANGIVLELRGSYIEIPVGNGYMYGGVGLTGSAYYDSGSSVDIKYSVSGNGSIEINWIDWDD